MKKAQTAYRLPEAVIRKGAPGESKERLAPGRRAPNLMD